MAKDSRPVGRPTKVTADVVTKLEMAFAIGCPVEEACSYAGISRKVFYEWIKRHPEYSDRIDDLREKPFLKARQTIYDSLASADHAFRFMERKKKKEFGTGIDPLIPEDAQLTQITFEIVNAPTKENKGDIPNQKE